MEPKAPLAHCGVCPLAKAECAPTSGPKDAKVAFVSRSPGFHDVTHRTPHPFAGPSGKVLDHLLQLHGVQRSEILTTNVVLCRTDDPPPKAIEACRDRLEAEIAEAELVIAAGSEAVGELVEGRWTVTSARGRDHYRSSASGRTQRVVATTNPAVVLRESGNFPDMIRDFRRAFAPIPEPELPTVYIYDSVVEALDFLEHLLECIDKGEIDLIASDLENNDKIACAGFSWDASEAHVIGYEPLQHPNTMVLLKELYEDEKITWLWHNGKYDIKVLRRNGISARVDEDTFILSYALDERPGGDYTGDQGAGLHGLTPILMEDYGWPDYEPNSVKHFKKTGEITDPEALYKYNGFDTAGTMLIYPSLLANAKADGVYERPYRHSQVPLANALVNVELRGFHYDIEAAADLNEQQVLPLLWGLRDELREISGKDLLNPRSNVQLKKLLYDEWGLVHDLKDTSKKKKQGSVDSDVRREILAGRFRCKTLHREQMIEFVTRLETYAKVEKQRGSFIEGLIKRVQPDGKLYSTFKFGTVTGRTSSEDPNFQNITRSGAFGLPSIRTLFHPSPGCKIIQADYSQAELRTVAVLSGDKDLLAIYRDSTRSLHKERAARFYGEDYNKEQYTYAKNMNFGVTYGQSAFTFSQLYEIPEKEAQAYIDQWWSDFPGIRNWAQKVQITVQTDGTIVSPLGHKRRFHLITKENKHEVFREAVNFLPQNIAGVLTELALVELDQLGVPIVSTVHDSIVVDCPEMDVPEVAVLMKNVMESQVEKHLGWTDIPFLVDISVGDNWADVEEIEVDATYGLVA